MAERSSLVRISDPNETFATDCVAMLNEHAANVVVTEHTVSKV